MKVEKEQLNIITEISMDVEKQTMDDTHEENLTHLPLETSYLLLL